MRFRRRLRRPCGSSPLTRGKRAVLRLHAVGVRLIPAHAGKTSFGVTSSRPITAHPRSRGENISATLISRPARGSSPLTRGKRSARAFQFGRPRLIPAHAGKTRRDAGLAVSNWAHPRSRGENTPPPSCRRSPRGSSPLTRGKRLRRGTDHCARRLIPAHAGKTLPDMRFYCADRSDLGNP